MRKFLCEGFIEEHCSFPVIYTGIHSQGSSLFKGLANVLIGYNPKNLITEKRELVLYRKKIVLESIFLYKLYTVEFAFDLCDSCIESRRQTIQNIRIKMVNSFSD